MHGRLVPGKVNKLLYIGKQRLELMGYVGDTIQLEVWLIYIIQCLE